MSDKKISDLLNWRENVPEGRLLNPGLPPFDLLEAPEWSVVSSSPGRLEVVDPREFLAVQEAVDRSPEDAETVEQGALEIDRRGLFEVRGGAADFTDFVTGQQDLGQHLVVEYEIVGILQQAQ